MRKTLLESLPEIVAEGKKEAERILDQLGSRHRVALQTRELVIPSKDTANKDIFRVAASSQVKSSQVKSSQVRVCYHKLV